MGTNAVKESERVESRQSGINKNGNGNGVRYYKQSIVVLMHPSLYENMFKTSSFGCVKLLTTSYNSRIELLEIKLKGASNG